MTLSGENLFAAKRVLVTGGTGTFGYEIVDRLIEDRPAEIRIFNRDKGKPVRMDEEYGLAQWLSAIDSFFSAVLYDVMQGSILMRPEDRANEVLQPLLHQYRTADFLDYKYPRGANLNTLTGGNMVVRREVLFAEVGMFGDRLGHGGFGVSEDVEFATRVFRAGRRLVGSQPSGFIMNWIQAVFAKMSFGAGVKPGDGAVSPTRAVQFVPSYRICCDLFLLFPGNPAWAPYARSIGRSVAVSTIGRCWRRKPRESPAARFEQ